MFAMEFLPGIVDDIFSADNKHLLKMKEEVVAENAQLTGNGTGFLYQGEFITILDNPKSQRLAKKYPCHPEVQEAAGRYVRQRDKMRIHRRKVEQGLMIVLRDCKSLQDMRDALPDLLRNSHEKLKDLPRTRDEAYTIAEQPLKQVAYEDTVRLVYRHLASRMLL